ncbi:MAG: hypothetical protein ACJ8H8_19575, partial [Geminicoccaceae bacterium]
AAVRGRLERRERYLLVFDNATGPHLVRNPGHAGAASPARGRSETEEWRKRWVFPCPFLSGSVHFP